jgi:hypothetical protein
VPYIVAAPLLIQDVASWREQGAQLRSTPLLAPTPELCKVRLDLDPRLARGLEHGTGALALVRSGIGGLQGTVLYALPELDGAADRGTFRATLAGTLVLFWPPCLWPSPPRALHSCTEFAARDRERLGGMPLGPLRETQHP